MYSTCRLLCLTDNEKIIGMGDARSNVVER